MTPGFTFAAYGAGPVHTGQRIWLPLLMHEVALGGASVIEGRTFIDCELHGPAVIVPVSGCNFASCNLGSADGDMANLMLQPLGPTKITGCIPFRDCQFERCGFFSVAYTGAPDFLNELRGIGVQS